EALARQPDVFEALHALEGLYLTHNELPFYTWGDEECCLPRGATRASLRGHYPDLRAGDVLILAEMRGPNTGVPEDADPARRHAVRLTAVSEPLWDPLGDRFDSPEAIVPPGAAGAPVTEIEWHS